MSASEYRCSINAGRTPTSSRRPSVRTLRHWSRHTPRMPVKPVRSSALRSSSSDKAAAVARTHRCRADPLQSCFQSSTHFPDRAAARSLRLFLRALHSPSGGRRQEQEFHSRPSARTGYRESAHVRPHSIRLRSLHPFRRIQRSQSRWRQRRSRIEAADGGTMSTAGGLVFMGNSAFDASTGEKLWEEPLLGDRPVSWISYMLDGKQFVTILARSSPNNRLFTFMLDGKEPMPPLPVPAPGRGRGNASPTAAQ